MSSPLEIPVAASYVLKLNSTTAWARLVITAGVGKNTTEIKAPRGVSYAEVTWNGGARVDCLLNDRTVASIGSSAGSTPRGTGLFKIVNDSTDAIIKFQGVNILATDMDAPRLGFTIFQVAPGT